ncbi:hypothetical protein BDN72DRAFT_834205 [Pluteus cervinus]|uniref:Uncharacterized protein n=1 Tax=Pluteus cervinus TaxID=181527 RepID=A0ACD3B8B2_9AGAR|nr:hypothetical protein BDN72DRAFT_834205 [Pluteus cervinus]
MTTSQKSISSGDHLDLGDEDTQQLYARFPPEIEYEIFVLAFESRKKRRTDLLCVAKRVEDWLCPHIYNVLVFRGRNEPPLSAIQKYGHHVQQILVIDRPETPISASDIFEHCPNIWNLGFWVGLYLSEGVFQLKDVRRLVLHDLNFFRAEEGGREVDAIQADGSAPDKDSDLPLSTVTSIDKKIWFSNITHILVTSISTESGAVLLQFPNLTHLGLLSSNSLQVLEYILHSHPRLEILVWLLVVIGSDDKMLVLDVTSTQAPRTDDKRVVTIDTNFTEDWTRAAKRETTEDMWKVAERTVEERKKRAQT